MKNLGLPDKKMIKNIKAKVFRPPKSGGKGMFFDLKVETSFLAK